MKKIILIGGAPSTGKSFLGNRISRKWANCFNNRLESEAKKYKYPIVEFKRSNIPISELKKIL